MSHFYFGTDTYFYYILYKWILQSKLRWMHQWWPNVRRICWCVYRKRRKVVIYVQWFVERRADNLPTPRGELHQPLCSGRWQQHDRQHAVRLLLWGPAPHCLHYCLTHHQHGHWPLQHLRLPRTHERGPGEGCGQSSLPPQRGTQYKPTAIHSKSLCHTAAEKQR